MSPIQREIDELKVRLDRSNKWLGLVPNIECDYLFLSSAPVSIHLRTIDYKVVLKTIRAFARIGFKIAIRDKSHNCTSFAYTLKNKSNDIIDLWFPVSASKSCKRVKVGEEIKPIYKLVCE